MASATSGMLCSTQRLFEKGFGTVATAARGCFAQRCQNFFEQPRVKEMYYGIFEQLHTKRNFLVAMPNNPGKNVN
jgi:hypothetical protein